MYPPHANAHAIIATMDRIGLVFVPGSGNCRAWPTAFWFAALLFVSACATGPKEGAQAIPPLDPGKGRVFVYRSSTTGAVYVPEVLLNGASVGKLAKVGVIFRDVPPGSYAVATTMSSKIANFAVGAGEKKYVKLTGGFFDSHMHPEMVDPAKGEAEVSGIIPMGPAKK